jgi:hypothetical protein
MAKAKKTVRKPNRSAEVLTRVEAFLDKIAPDVVKRLTDAEMRANQNEKDLAFIRYKLASLLSQDQLESANICGMSPEIYALNCIELWKDGKIGRSVFEIKLKPLSEVKLTGPY